LLHHVNQIDLFEDGGVMFVRNVHANIADCMMSSALSIVIRILLQWNSTFCVEKRAVFIVSALSVNPLYLSSFHYTLKVVAKGI